MARNQAKSNIKNNRRQPPIPKDQGEVFQGLYLGGELTIGREAVSRHQQTASLSQKCTSRSLSQKSTSTSLSQKSTSTSNTTVPQAVPLQKQSYSGSAGTSLPSGKQHPRGQKSMCPHCFSYHVIALTCLRHHSARKSFTNHPRLHENGNEGKKNKKLGIPLLELESSVSRSDCKPRLRSVSTRKHLIRRRRVTSARTTLTRFSTGFRLESGERSTSNKIARSEKTSRGASHQKNLNNGIGYESVTSESRSKKCKVLLIYLISLRERSPPLHFVASTRNQPSRHLAINCRGDPKAPNTIIQTMKSGCSERGATCASPL